MWSGSDMTDLVDGVHLLGCPIRYQLRWTFNVASSQPRCSNLRSVPEITQIGILKPFLIVSSESSIRVKVHNDHWPENHEWRRQVKNQKSSQPVPQRGFQSITSLQAKQRYGPREKARGYSLKVQALDSAGKKYDFQIFIHSSRCSTFPIPDGPKRARYAPCHTSLRSVSSYLLIFKR